MLSGLGEQPGTPVPLAGWRRGVMRGAGEGTQDPVSGAAPRERRKEAGSVLVPPAAEHRPTRKPPWHRPFSRNEPIRQALP